MCTPMQQVLFFWCFYEVAELVESFEQLEFLHKFADTLHLVVRNLILYRAPDLILQLLRTNIVTILLESISSLDSG